MGIGFLVTIILLSGLLGMFARQALANVDNHENSDSSSGSQAYNPPGEAEHRNVM